MDSLSIFFLIIIITLSLFAVVLLRIDSDFALLCTERWGKSPEILTGKIVWITGASSGIGEYLAYELAKYGCKLVLSARREEELSRVKRECLARSGLVDNDILILPMDVTDVEHHGDFFQLVLDHFGRLDILINNAGRTQRAQFERIDLEVDRQIFDLNVFSVVSLTRIVVRHFLEQKSGHIVAMSSFAGKFGVPGSASYTGSKHAIHGYMECLRVERGNQIKVTLLCPGPVYSNLLESAFTEKPNEQFGQAWTKTDKRMGTDRCAHLCVVAIANEMDEAWMAPYPLMAIMYACQYFPTLTRRMLTRLGMKTMMKFRDASVSNTNAAEIEAKTEN